MWEFYISAFMELLTESSKTQTKRVGWIKISSVLKTKLFVLLVFTLCIYLLIALESCNPVSDKWQK